MSDPSIGTSVLHTVRILGVATIEDVMHEQGLCEVKTSRALAKLVQAKLVVKVGNRYRVPDGKRDRKC